MFESLFSPSSVTIYEIFSAILYCSYYFAVITFFLFLIFLTLALIDYFSDYISKKKEESKSNERNNNKHVRTF